MSSSPPPTSSNELLPLIIGITGHRNLREEDIPELEKAVRCVLCEMCERYPHTPLVVLSPLGEGADRLVARIAMEEGAQLFVPLPLPRAFYETSFTSDDSRDEFAFLLSKATSVYTLPWVEHSHDVKTGFDPDALTPAQIEGQYAAMGSYIARYSHVFLALWDGDDTPNHERTGGTSQIVRFRLHSAPPPYGPVLSPLERAGYGAVHHIVTPRQSNPPKDKEPFSCHILPDEHSAEDYSRIDTFNADVLNFKKTMSDDALGNADSLVANKNNASAHLIPPSLQPSLDVYGWSDALSTYFSRQMARTVRRIFFLVFLAAVSFNLFHSLPHGHHAPSAEHTDHEAVAVVAGEPAAASEAPGNHAAPAAADHTAPSDHASPAAADHVAPSDHASPAAADHAAPAASHAAPADAHAQPADHAAPAAADHAAPADAHAQPADHSAPAADHGAGADSHGAAAAGGHGEEHGGGSLWSLLPWFLWIYLGLVVMNFLVHQRAQKNDFQNKYQDYRALAEGLRVQIFWRLAGLHDDVSDHYLAKQRGELNWIRNAIKSCNVMADGQIKSHLADEGERMGLVVKQWVQEQRNYYVRKAHREQEELEKQEQIITGFLMASIVLALLLSLLLSMPAVLPIPVLEQIKEAIEDPWAHAMIMITIVMLAVIAGLLHGYNEQLARAEHSKRYGRMGILFNDACTELEAQLKAGHYQKMHSLLHELGREALVENGDWVMLHRERPLEVPHAG